MSDLTPITYVIRPATNDDAAAVREVVFSTLAEFALPVLPETTDADLNDLKASYFQTGGTFEVVVSPDGRIVGCVGLCLLGDGRAEVRKLYLRSEARQTELWDLLLKRMALKARDLGCKQIHLETSLALRDVERLCLGHGFTAAKPEHPSARCDMVYYYQFYGSPRSGEPGWRELPKAWPLPWPGRKPLGVPRQFGVGTALMMMTMFAILFAVLQCLHVPAIVFAVIALFFFGVGAGQAVLFHGRRPRAASIVMGMVMTLVLFTIDAIWTSFRFGRPFFVPDSFLQIVCGGVCGGGFYGYLAGLLIASVFLIRDLLANAYRRRFPPKDDE
jgi:putative acetyltransferase